MALVIKKSEVHSLLDKLAEKYILIAPKKKGEEINFDYINEGKEACLNYINTKYSPKSFFIPDGETIFKYKKSNINFYLRKEKRIIFGLRPCDAHSLEVLDNIFLGEIKDPYYMNKRKNTILIVINCSDSGENCFCQSMGTDRTKEYDILLSETEKYYVLEDYKKKYKNIIKYFKKSKRPKIKKLKNKRKLNSKNIEKKLLKVFKNKKWEKISNKCLSCGGCTIVCPTCYCFNLEDKPDFGGSGERKRYWSSCMLKGFSRVSGGNFRQSRTERCKQFVFHKLSYFKEKYGKQLCVGCGRCVEICPTGIDFFREVEKMVKK